MSDVDAMQPAVVPPAEPVNSRIPGVRTVDTTAPLRWLARGWDDFRHTGMRGAFYGMLFALMGGLIALVYATRWQLTMGLTAGFFLIGPFVCTGIYELSRQRARGEPTSLPARAPATGLWARPAGPSPTPPTPTGPRARCWMPSGTPLAPTASATSPSRG